MSALGTAPLLIVALPALAGAGYLARLAVFARPIAPYAPDASLRFTVVVPAHDEATGIEQTVQSLLALDYPREQFRVLVVADNCSDATAELARKTGAEVIERTDPANRGKGFALSFGFEAVLRDGWADAVAVVDADTLVSANLLGTACARLVAGAECAQAEYGVRNVGDSWRTRLMSLALTLHHTLRSLGREQLALSCGLRGNGMVFRTRLLKVVPHTSTALTEDIEYGLTLGLAGIRVAYLPHATVLGEMPTDEASARLQRDRWERGRRILKREWSKPLMRAAAHRDGGVAFDLLADLWVPPLVSFTAFVGLGWGVSIGLWAKGWAGASAPTFWTLAITLLLVYILRGCALSEAGWRVLRDVLWVPVYALWKVWARLRSRGGSGWERTPRILKSTRTPDKARV